MSENTLFYLAVHLALRPATVPFISFQSTSLRASPAIASALLGGIVLRHLMLDIREKRSFEQ